MSTNNTVTHEATQKKIQERVLATLAELGGRLHREDDIQFAGTKFILPSNCRGISDAVKFLTARAEEEETITQFSREFNFRPWDGAYATSLAIREAFGFGIAKPIMGFFGPNPPQMITITTGPGTSVEVPWGKIMLPGFENTYLYLGKSQHAVLGIIFSITVEAPRKYRDEIQGFFRLVEEKLRTDSIYRGKAIDGATMPNYLDLTSITPDDVVYTQEVMRQLEANVWSPIRHAKQLEALRQPGKRSLILEGPYGSGKTLAALLTAQVAVDSGWTFLLCRPEDDFAQVMQTAQMYQPAVVFNEDLDVMAGVGSDEKNSRNLDLFDGIKAKGLKLLLVLTTNHIEQLHKGMLRPGRLDAVIHVGAMDAPGVEKLTKRVVGASLAKNIDWEQVYQAVDGFMPAFVKEAIDRAVRYSVARGNGELGPIDTEDLVLAAHSLRPQLDLMENAGEQSTRDSMGDALKGVVQNVVEQVLVRSYIDGEHIDVYEDAAITREVDLDPSF